MKQPMNNRTNPDLWITFTFEGLKTVTLKITDVSPSNDAYATLRDLASRIEDNTATVTEAMRREAVIALITDLAKSYAEQ